MLIRATGHDDGRIIFEPNWHRCQTIAADLVDGSSIYVTSYSDRYVTINIFGPGDDRDIIFSADMKGKGVEIRTAEQREILAAVQEEGK